MEQGVLLFHQHFREKGKENDQFGIDSNYPILLGDQFHNSKRTHGLR